MIKRLSLALLLLSLNSCSYFQIHKLDIEQGNVMTPDNTRELHVGMSKERVEAMMGTPLLVNLFSPSRVEYVYTVQQGHGTRQTTRISCIFNHGRLQEIVRAAA